MITVTVYQHGGDFRGFRAEGHAEYADPGEDIFCAAASALMVNTINSIDLLTDDPVEDEEASEGFLRCSFPAGLTEGGRLLMDSMLLGIRQMTESADAVDDRPYVQLLFEEV